MRGKFHMIVNDTWYSILFDHKLTKLFSIENFSGAKNAEKVLIIIIILFLFIIIIIIIAIIKRAKSVRVKVHKTGGKDPGSSF